MAISIETNKAIVRRFFEEAWNQNKVADLNEYLSANNLHHFGTRTGRRGPNELRKMIKNWLGGLPDFEGAEQIHRRRVTACSDRQCDRESRQAERTAAVSIAPDRRVAPRIEWTPTR